MFLHFQIKFPVLLILLSFASHVAPYFLCSRGEKTHLEIWTCESTRCVAQVLVPEHHAFIRISIDRMFFFYSYLLFLATPRCTFYIQSEKKIYMGIYKTNYRSWIRPNDLNCKIGNS